MTVYLNFMHLFMAMDQNQHVMLSKPLRLEAPPLPCPLYSQQGGSKQAGKDPFFFIRCQPAKPSSSWAFCPNTVGDRSL